MTKLYVANLPYSATDDILRDIFEHAGAVRSAWIVKDRETGQSRGCGVVVMATTQAAAEAIAQFDGDMYDGRVVRVEPFRDSRRAA